MNIYTIRAAFEELEHQGQTPSVRKICALTGGSMRDVSRLLREIKSQEGAAFSTYGNALKPAQSVPFTPKRKSYTCQRFPSLRIRHIQFTNRAVVTSDPREQALLESNDWFNLYIHTTDE